MGRRRDSKPCTPSTLKSAPVSPPVTESPTAADSLSSELSYGSAPVQFESVKTTKVDKPPWSLLFVPGGFLMALATLMLDAGRRKRDDTDDIPPPPLPWSGAGLRSTPPPPTIPTTIEKPGTGNADAVQAPEYQVDPDAPPIGFSDTMWRTLQLATSQRQQTKDGYAQGSM